MVRTWEDKFLHARVAGTEETVQLEMLSIADEQTSDQQQNSLRSKTKRATHDKSSRHVVHKRVTIQRALLQSNVNKTKLLRRN